MDANGTRFHLLLGKDDWGRCTAGAEEAALLSPPWYGLPPAGRETELRWDGERHELTLVPRLFRFIASPYDKKPEIGARRGAARDRFGNWYWIDASRVEILVNSAGTGITSHFWSSGDKPGCAAGGAPGGFTAAEPVQIPATLLLSGLTVTDDHYLVAGTVTPAGLLIFDLYGGGQPLHLHWPDKVPFSPYDMAPRAGGGLLILDRDNACYWTLDRHFNVVDMDQQEFVLSEGGEEEFQPLAGARRRTARQGLPRGVSLDTASPSQVIYPIAIEALQNGDVLILDRNKGENDPAGTEAAYSTIHLYSKNGQPLGKVSTEIMADLSEERESLIGHDFAFVPAHMESDRMVPGRLYVVAEDGNQAFAFSLSTEEDRLHLEAVPEYLPMRLFGGKGLVSAGEQTYYDFDDRWIPLVRQHRPRYEEEATILTPLFDGREPDCIWHRLTLDAVLPPETKVEIRSRAANHEYEVPTAEWKNEPDPYRRGDGSELPFAGAAAKGVHTWESLFQNAHGRYLQLEIKLTGNGRATPRLRALRVYYPRFSYLDHYLPAVYRERKELPADNRDKPGSAPFLDRFLANFEGIYTSLEDKIAGVQILFDPRSAPPEALEWLAGWFGVALDPAWDERRQRLFIRHAMDFFQYRGTIRGMQMALRLALDECADESIFTESAAKQGRQSPIRIVERFRTRRTPGIVFGDTSAAESGPRLVTPATRWSPGQGRDELRRRYAIYGDPQGAAGRLTDFPVVKPDGNEEATIWRRFSEDMLGFVPSAGKDDLKLWRDFLARRYRTIGQLNNGYDTSCPSFEAVPLPQVLPPDGAPLLDWFQFEGVVLPMRRNAHRFGVMLPAPKSQTADSTEYQRRLGLARRIIELEKPAHTIFTVNFYWAMFRVGEARVGYDTVVDLGSRAPEFMAAMVLDRQHLGESFIGSLHPQLPDRYTLGETESK